MTIVIHTLSTPGSGFHRASRLHHSHGPGTARLPGVDCLTSTLKVTLHTAWYHSTTLTDYASYDAEPPPGKMWKYIEAYQTVNQREPKGTKAQSSAARTVVDSWQAWPGESNFVTISEEGACLRMASERETRHARHGRCSGLIARLLAMFDDGTNGICCQPATLPGWSRLPPEQHNKFPAFQPKTYPLHPIPVPSAHTHDTQPDKLRLVLGCHTSDHGTTGGPRAPCVPPCC